MSSRHTFIDHTTINPRLKHNKANKIQKNRLMIISIVRTGESLYIHKKNCSIVYTVEFLRGKKRFFRLFQICKMTSPFPIS